MLDVMRGRRSLVASAAIVILLIMGFLFATVPSWRSFVTQGSGPVTSPLAPVAVSAPPPSPAPGAANSQPVPGSPASQPIPADAGSEQASLADPVAASRQSSPGSSAGQAPGAATTDEASAPAPSFDVVRVEPSGDSVIAARGAPNAEVVLLDGNVPIARAKTDANGQVAFLPPALKPGEHSLTLSVTGGAGGPAVSSQSVAVSMPDQPKTAPLVALIQPNQPTAILSGPVAGSSPAAGQTEGPAHATAVPSPVPAPVVIRSVEVESLGSFYASGKAPPGSASRVYLNGAFVATVMADSNGNWSLKINKGMKPGRYAVRVDQTDPSGKVVARAEVPFDYPSQVAGTGPRPESAKKNTTSKPAGASGPVIAASPGTSGQGGSAPAIHGADGERVAAAGTAARQDGRGQAGKTAGLATGSPDSSAGGAGAAPAPGATQIPGTPPGASASGALQAGAKPAGRAPSSVTASSAGGAMTAPGSAASTAGVGLRTAPAIGQRPATVTSQNKARSQTVVALNESGQGAQAPSMSAGSGITTASDGPQPSAPAGDLGDASSPTVVAELVTAKVIRGDSLWRISRQMLGHGMRYTQIYAANTQQIRDPKLIYPGQVFVLPTQ